MNSQVGQQQFNTAVKEQDNFSDSGMTQQLRAWQQEAVSAFYSNNCKITIEACTGSGKSFVGITILNEYLKHSCILIVCPNIAILDQWYNQLKQLYPELLITKYFGEEKQWGKITIACINSLWNTKIPEQFLLIIWDEAHHMVSPESYKVVESVKNRNMLSLSATIERSDQMEHLLTDIMPIKYSLSQKEAIKQDIIAPFEIKLEKVLFNQEKQDKYNEISEEIRECLANFGFDHRAAMAYLKYSRSPKGQIAMRYLKVLAQRKEMLQTSPEKIEKAFELIKTNLDKKIIVFNERIESAQSLHSLCQQNNLKTGVYHSGIKKKERLKILDDFKNNNINILVTVKSLDEGLDVIGANTAIIVSGNSTKRQTIQRIGRVLRKQENKVATVHYIYICGTKDFQYAKKILKYINDGDTDE